MNSSYSASGNTPPIPLLYQGSRMLVVALISLFISNAMESFTSIGGSMATPDFSILSAIACFKFICVLFQYYEFIFYQPLNFFKNIFC